MSKLAEALRAHKIINVWDLLKRFGDQGRDVGVYYHARPSGRMGMAQCCHSQVFSPTFLTAPKAPWYDEGLKTFVGDRAESFPAAIKWASETYNIQEWVPFGPGSRVPKYVMDRAKEMLDEAQGSQTST